MIEELRRIVCRENKRLAELGLAPLTWGNVSGIDRERGLVVIKPSGVRYDELTPEAMAVIDLDGEAAGDGGEPSTDWETHLALYRAWPEIGGVTHTHSRCATMFAQARRAIPCLGTSHADSFHGEVPVTRSLAKDEIVGAYEMNTGRVIVERFEGMRPLDTPGVLVAQHGPFTWGTDAVASVTAGLILELVADMALGTLALAPDAAPLDAWLLDKHYERKHGPNAYYGQKG